MIGLPEEVVLVLLVEDVEDAEAMVFGSDTMKITRKACMCNNGGSRERENEKLLNCIATLTN